MTGVGRLRIAHAFLFLAMFPLLPLASPFSTGPAAAAQEPPGTDIYLHALEPVGYYAWADGETVALYVLGDPSRLVVHRPGGGRADTVARDVGRSLHPIPGRTRLALVASEER